MAIKSFKPYSAGRRFMTVASFDEITTDKPEKSLVESLKSHGGRNQQGRMTVRHQGGGHKRRYRIIDFKRTKDGIPARVATIEYEPQRSHRPPELRGRREALHPRTERPQGRRQGGVGSRG